MRALCFCAVSALSLCSATHSGAAAPPVAWESGNGFRRLNLAPDGSGPGFTLMRPEALGIRWTNRLSAERYATRQNLMNGAGVALGDYDGDGWCDLYLCNKEGANGLFRNCGGWQFTNVTEYAGVSCSHLISVGAVFGDLNGDRLLDLFVTSFLGPDALFLNLGDGRFTNITLRAGVASKGGTTSAAFADLDGDGDLDLYVCHFGIEAILRDGGAFSIRTVGGKPVVTGRYAKRLKMIDGKLLEFGEPDVLYLNDGTGKFSAASWSATFLDEDGSPLPEAPPDFGLAVQIRDINTDGHPDIYVCNDFQTPDRIWLNDGQGRFRALPRLALRNMSYASMGVDFADIDRDGALDFITVEMLSREQSRNLTTSSMDPLVRVPGDVFTREAVPRNVLQWNCGDGTYAEIAWFAGVAMSDWSWTPIFLDVDLDGFEDLLVSNGHLHDVNDRDVSVARTTDRSRQAEARQILMQYPRLEPPKAAWRNRGDRTFADTANQWGFNSTQIVHGMALADLDNDGDLDLVASAHDSPPLIYRNNAPGPRIAVRLRGLGANAEGIGARVRLAGKPLPAQEQEMIAGGRYLSGDQTQRTFAAGTNLASLALEVRWRSGRLSRLNDVRPNSLYEIDEATALSSGPPAAQREARPSLFEALPLGPELVHREAPFDDFARQTLLPWRLSRLGPGVAWFDGDGDGVEELLMGNGRGARLCGAHFRSGAPSTSAPFTLGQPLPDDAMAVLGIVLTPGTRSVLVSVANFESRDTNQPAVLRFDHGPGGYATGEALPADSSSPGALSAGDIDGDGDLDVVVGGRWIPDRYPEPADTRVFRNDAGRLVFDPALSAPLKGVGLVTGATLSDVTGDGRPDLVLACEWGPVKVFLNQMGRFEEATGRLGLASHTGRWQSVTTADLDGDGTLDIVAGNWGRNSFCQRSGDGSWSVFFADFDQDRVVSIIEAFSETKSKRTVPFRSRDMLGAELRWLPEKFPKHHAFASASVTEILGAHLAQARKLEVNTLASHVFFNRRGRFDAVELPAEAQWTPVFGLCAADFDGDGDLDLFCAQNLFAVRNEDDRFDAGRGLLLRNEGEGRLTALSAEQTGISIPGEQRGAAAADFNGDGRLDLVVAQNAAAPVVLLNRGAASGVRIRFRGPLENPDAIGTRFRFRGPDQRGPMSEIRAGGGYLSQDSSIQIVPAFPAARELWVRFPGGVEQSVRLTETTSEMEIDQNGVSKGGR